MSCATSCDAQDRPGLLLHELQAILEAKVLRHLSLVDLGRLACCSVNLRQLVDRAPVSLWRCAAGTQLGARHPALFGSTTEIRAALQRQQSRQAVLRHRRRWEPTLTSAAACSRKTLLSLSPDSRLAAGTACTEEQHHYLTLTDLHTGTSQSFQDLADIVELQWWPNSSQLSTVHRDSWQLHAVSRDTAGTLQLELLHSQARSPPVPQHHSQHLSPCGRYLTMLPANLRSSSLDVIEAATGQARHLSLQHPAHNTSWRWAADESKLAVLQQDEEGMFWVTATDVSSHKQVLSTAIHGTDAALGQWSPTGLQLSVKVMDRDTMCIVIVDLSMPLRKCRLLWLHDFYGALLGELRLAWDPTGHELAVMGPWDVRIIEASSGKVLRSLGCRAPGCRWIGDFAWSGDGLYLAIGASDDAICILDAQTGKVIATVREQHFGFALCNLQFSSDGDHLLWNGCWWNMTCQWLSEFCPEHHSPACYNPSDFLCAKMVTFLPV